MEIFLSVLIIHAVSSMHTSPSNCVLVFSLCIYIFFKHILIVSFVMQDYTQQNPKASGVNWPYESF